MIKAILLTLLLINSQENSIKQTITIENQDHYVLWIPKLTSDEPETEIDVYIDSELVKTIKWTEKRTFHVKKKFDKYPVTTNIELRPKSTTAKIKAEEMFFNFPPD